MKGKQLIWLGMGMVSICSMLYRAPQIAGVMSGGDGAGGPGGAGGPVGEMTPTQAGGAISGLLTAIGKQPLPNGDLSGLGLSGLARAEEDVREAPEASDLRIFGAEKLSETEARRVLEAAARQHPARSLQGTRHATNDSASATKKLRPSPKVVVCKPDAEPVH